MTSTVLFDLDGTLSDSAPGILAALRHAFDVNGIARLDPATERSLLGPPFYTSLPPLIGGEDRLPAVIASYREHYAGGSAGGSRSSELAGSMYDTAVYDGVAAVVAAAHVAGRRLAVATSKPEPMAVLIVEHLGFGDYFKTVGGDELDGSLGTKALVIDKVLARLGNPDPADVLMVGDREHDVIGAREHGIACLGAGWGYGAPGELTAAGAAVVCETPWALVAALGLDAAFPAGTDAAAT